MLEYDILSICEFCGLTLLKTKYASHVRFCNKNPQAEQRKKREIIGNKRFYDFTKEYFKTNIYGSSKTLTYIYSRKYTYFGKGDAKYRSMKRSFGQILRRLCQEGYIEKYNGTQYKKVINPEGWE